MVRLSIGLKAKNFLYIYSKSQQLVAASRQCRRSTAHHNSYRDALVAS